MRVRAFQIVYSCLFSFRFAGLLIFSAIGFGLSGCAIIGAELNNRGGFIDQKLDERWLTADTKQMRVLRAYVLIGSTLRMAKTEYATERTLIVAHANAAIKIISDAHACAYSQPGTCVYFDERMAEAEVAVIRLMISVISRKDELDLVGAITTEFSESMPWLKGVNSLSNLLDAASEAGQLITDTPKFIKGLIKTGQLVYLTGRQLGALYRDSIELYMVATISSLDTMCAIKNNLVRRNSSHDRNDLRWAISNFYGSPHEQPDGVCEDAAEGKLLWARGAGDFASWKDFLNKTTAAYSYKLLPDKSAFQQASDLVFRACEYVTSDVGELSDCIGRVKNKNVDCASPLRGDTDTKMPVGDARTCLLIDYADLNSLRSSRRSRAHARMDWLSNLAPDPSAPEEY